MVFNVLFHPMQLLDETASTQLDSGSLFRSLGLSVDHSPLVRHSILFLPSGTPHSSAFLLTSVTTASVSVLHPLLHHYLNVEELWGSVPVYLLLGNS